MKLCRCDLVGYGAHDPDCPIGEAARNPHEPLIGIRLEIDNVYPDETVRTYADLVVPAPPTTGDPDDVGAWESDHLFEVTGTGREDGDAGYFLRVLDSSRRDLIPIGYRVEFL